MKWKEIHWYFIGIGVFCTPYPLAYLSENHKYGWLISGYIIYSLGALFYLMEKGNEKKSEREKERQKELQKERDAEIWEKARRYYEKH